ncbi:hypothetical protein HYY72_00515 [Candidatus Woesearchaeota archaeon]|nr:hypothetical protein [Candidatus Woesearchaeota archaeon]
MNSTRDCAQTPELDLQAWQKLRIAQAMGRLATGRDPIFEETGWPNSNAEDLQAYRELPNYELRNVIPVVFGSTRKVGVHALDDLTIISLLQTMAYGVKTAAIFGKSDPEHVRYALGTTLEDNLGIVQDSVSALKAAEMEVIFDAEHFFDGFNKDPNYAAEVVSMAARAGASTIALCDTNGKNLYFAVGAITREVINRLRTEGFNVPVGIHVHNDGELAVANSLEALLNGASHFQGVINGKGERAGNANLKTLMGWMLYGKHTAGVHQDAENKRKGLYTAFNLSLVGNDGDNIVLGLQSGASHIVVLVEKILGHKPSKKDPRVVSILNMVKSMSSRGYQIGFIDAEQELMVHTAYGWQPPFRINGFRTETNRYDGHTDSTARVNLEVNGTSTELERRVQENGEVNALYSAMIDGVRQVYGKAGDIEVIGFSSVSKQHGPNATVRTYFEFGMGDLRWGCVGVSTNLVNSAAEALEKGINYALLKADEPQRRA